MKKITLNAINTLVESSKIITVDKSITCDAIIQYLLSSGFLQSVPGQRTPINRYRLILGGYGEMQPKQTLESVGARHTAAIFLIPPPGMPPIAMYTGEIKDTSETKYIDVTFVNTMNNAEGSATVPTNINKEIILHTLTMNGFIQPPQEGQCYKVTVKGRREMQEVETLEDIGAQDLDRILLAVYMSGCAFPPPVR